MDQTDCFVNVTSFKSISSQNNREIFQRVINQVLFEYGGLERCPWTRAITEGTLPFSKAMYSNVFVI